MAEISTLLPEALRKENTNTLRPPPGEGPSSPPDDPREDWQRAREELRALSPAPRPGTIRLALQREGEVCSVTLELNEDAYVVLGRHTHANLRLVEDEQVSLRHVMVLPRRRKDCSYLEFLDLDGATPMVLEGNVMARSARVYADTTFQIGKHLVHVFGLHEGASGSSATTPGPARADRTEGGRAGPYSVPAAPPIAEPRPPVQIDAREAGLHLRVKSARGNHEVTVPSLLLERGVVIGRTKCFDRAMIPLLTMSVSRAHLLIRLEAGRVYAYDLCSSWGTHFELDRVRRVAVQAEGTQLVLGHAGNPTFLGLSASRQS